MILHITKTQFLFNKSKFRIVEFEIILCFNILFKCSDVIHRIQYDESCHLELSIGINCVFLDTKLYFLNYYVDIFKGVILGNKIVELK